MEGTAPSDYAASTECNTLKGKTFAQQIHAILAMPNYSSIISWNEAGTVVIIHDVGAFISTIMHAHFQHSQWGSFTRRMRRWGFRAANQRSSKPSTASTKGQSNVMEFSSENFLRDQPDLCLLMKDERQVKKKFTFLDRNVRRVGGGAEHGTQGSSAGVSVPHPPSSSRGGIVMPSSENKPGGSMTPPPAKKLPLPVRYRYPPSSTTNTAKNQPDSQLKVRESSTVLKSTGDDDLNVDMDVGFPQNYETSVLPMISSNVHSFLMPMMNTMPAQLPTFNYPPYGYGAPPPQGPGFWPVSPAFQYPYAPYGYPPPYQQPMSDRKRMVLQKRANLLFSEGS